LFGFHPRLLREAKTNKHHPTVAVNIAPSYQGSSNSFVESLFSDKDGHDTSGTRNSDRNVNVSHSARRNKRLSRRRGSVVKNLTETRPTRGKRLTARDRDTDIIRREKDQRSTARHWGKEGILQNSKSNGKKKRAKRIIPEVTSEWDKKLPELSDKDRKPVKTTYETGNLPVSSISIPRSSPSSFKNKEWENSLSLYRDHLAGNIPENFQVRPFVYLQHSRTVHNVPPVVTPRPQPIMEAPYMETKQNVHPVLPQPREEAAHIETRENVPSVRPQLIEEATLVEKTKTVSPVNQLQGKMEPNKTETGEEPKKMLKKKKISRKNQRKKNKYKRKWFNDEEAVGKRIVKRKVGAKKELKKKERRPEMILKCSSVCNTLIVDVYKLLGGHICGC